MTVQRTQPALANTSTKHVSVCPKCQSADFVCAEVSSTAHQDEPRPYAYSKVYVCEDCGYADERFYFN